MSACDILISLDLRHAENILSGSKKVEFRRRPMNIEKGTTIWIYVKIPVGRVVAKACVEEIFNLPPASLWKIFSKSAGLSRSEFFAYFSGVQRGFAVLLRDVHRLPEEVSLASLRLAYDKFHPPQFFMRLDENSSVLKALSA